MPVPDSGDEKIAVLQARGDELAASEAKFDTTQADVVNDLIEASCWSDHPLVNPYVGFSGTQQERLAALLQAMTDENAI